MRYLIFGGSLALLIGCTTLPALPSTTYAEADIAYTATVSSVDAALVSGVITVDQAKKAQAYLIQADGALKIARTAVGAQSVADEIAIAMQAIGQAKTIIGSK